MSLQQKIHEIRALGLIVGKTREVKDRSGKTNYTFANLGDVWLILKAPLEERNLSVGWRTGKIRQEGEGLVLEMTMEVSDGAERDFHEFEMPFQDRILSQSGNAITSAPQRKGVAIAFGKRTELSAFFNILVVDEDQVELMRVGDPRPPAGATESDSAPWYAYMDGQWKSVDAPDKDEDGNPIQLAYVQLKEAGAMWEKHPEHRALTARFADKVVSMLKNAGLTWQAFTARFPEAELPSSAIEECTPAAVRKAAELAKTLSQ